MAAIMGRIDVDRMMEEITPAQFQKWRAVLNEENSIDGWQQAATIAAAVANETRNVLYTFNPRGKKPTEVEPDFFIPKVRFHKKKTPPDSITEFEEIAKRKWG